MTREEYDRIRDENDAPDNEADAELEAELAEWDNLLHRRYMPLEGEDEEPLNAQEELDDVDAAWYDDEFNYEEDNHGAG